MVTFSWVKEVLDQEYPNANWVQGVDLNKDGKIQHIEKIKDFDNDSMMGSPKDWEKFRQLNAKGLQTRVRFFQSAAEGQLKVDNPIHDILAIEFHFVSKDQIEWAYLTVVKVLKKVRADLTTTQTPEEKLKLIYKAIQESGIRIINTSQSALLSLDLGRTATDNDTTAFIVLAVGHELGFPLKLVRASNTRVTVRWEDKKTSVDTDQGDRNSLLAMVLLNLATEFGLSAKETAQKLAHPRMDPVSRQKFQKALKKKTGDAIKFYDQAIALDPVYTAARLKRGQFLHAMRDIPATR